MADVTELQCWPSCIDALDWSQDGIIALASDERVELLVSFVTTKLDNSVLTTAQFPNTVSYDRDREAPQWQHIPLQVPWFTNEELPIKDPAPLANYSIGEEISSSASLAIAWSPPGLAKHRRCALAALTANLVLSIWSAEGKQQEASSWDRRLIVNNALAEYFLSRTTEDPSHVAPSVGEQMRLRTRIRAFTWAPALPNMHPSNTLGSQVSYDRHIVALCNDDNQLALVEIKSPTSSQGADQDWTAKVLTHGAIDPHAESIISAPSFFADILKQQRHISHISWSPWIRCGDRYYSIIAYSTNEDVRARIVTCTPNSVEMEQEAVYPNIEMRHHGPMKWCPTVGDNDLTLALFTASGLIYLRISIHDASIIERAIHELDRRWDQISGAAWDTAHRLTPRLHLSSLLSTIQSPTAVLEVTPGTLTPIGCPSWRDQIENSASLFSAKNDLKGNVKMKVWGLVTSPLGDFIATCHTVHPSDMIEYGSPADRRGTVAVSALLQYRQMRQSFPAWNVGAEGVLFTLKKLVDNTVEDGDQIPAFVEEMVEKLYQTYGPIELDSESSNKISITSVTEDYNMTIQEVKRTAFFDPNTLRDRYTILASHACASKNTNDLQRTLIAYRLAAALQDLPDALSTTAFSAEIRDHHQKMITLIQTLIEPEAPTTEAVHDTHQEIRENDAEPTTAAVSDPSSTETVVDSVQLDLAEVTVDTCDFCSAPIPFTDLITASCTNGHQFPRCGLSFLAIQAPGITKYCGICSTPFLNEQFVAAQEKEKQSNHGTDQGIGCRERRPREEGPDATLQQQTDGEVADHGGDITMEGNPAEHGQGQRSGTQSNGERVNAELENSLVDEVRKIRITLGRVLFGACDACIYCGGKFVG
jgi:hypothetical protein